MFSTWTKCYLLYERVNFLVSLGWGVFQVQSSIYPLFVKIAVYPFVCVSVCCPLKFITSDIDHRNTDFLKILILDLPVNSQNFGLIS